MLSVSLICVIYWEDKEETPGKLQQLSKGAAEKFALSKIQLHSQEAKGRMSALKEQFLQQQETISTG